MRNLSWNKPNIYVLGVHDLERKEELFYRVVNKALTRGLLPELDILYKHTYVGSLLEQTEYTNVYTIDDGTEAAFCSAFFTTRDPHMHGKGLYLNLLLSTGNAPHLVKDLVRSLITFAKKSACTWVAVHHRTEPRTYICRYRLLNKQRS